MKLVTYQTKDAPQLGALQDDQVIDLKSTYRAMVKDPEAAFTDDMIDLLTEGQAGLERLTVLLNFAMADRATFSHPLDQVMLLPPVPRPGKIIALGRNYAAHAAEGGAEPPKYPNAIL